MLTADYADYADLLFSLAALLLDEEGLLARDLPGYTDCQQRVRYRLVPYIW